MKIKERSILIQIYKAFTQMQKMGNIESDTLDHEHQINQMTSIEEVFQWLQEERQQKLELQQQLEDLHKSEEETKQKIEYLTNTVEKQKNEITMLRDAAEKQIQHLQTSVNDIEHREVEKESLENRVRNMTREQQQSKIREQQMMVHLEEQKEIITTLEKEKTEMKKMLEELQSNKMQQDDEMFNSLRDLQIKSGHHKERTLFHTVSNFGADSHNESTLDDVFFFFG